MSSDPRYPVKLIDALRIVSAPAPADGPRLEVALVCGFTPLHLKTYLAANLRLARPDAQIEISTGIFDDLVGNLERSAEADVDAIALIVEWADIDPRLGVRRAGRWKLPDLADLAETVELNLARLSHALATVTRERPVIVSLPSLPFPPLFVQPPPQSGEQELQVRSRLAAFAATVAQNERLRICSAGWLDQISPVAQRRDLKSELTAGFPYSLGHASAVAATVSALICPPPPKKGLITDLDGTLWAGIVGEIGPENVSWSLDDNAHRHALYQQLLASLASAGVLIAVASKNDPEPADQALHRSDLLLGPEAVFPIEVHWDAKSASVRRILDAWNVAPDAVVMVDDSPLELAEVQAVFPDITTIEFPSGDDGALWELLANLRSLFAKDHTTVEDGLRLASLRAQREFTRAAAPTEHTLDDFLSRVGGAIEISVGEMHKARALELINKTNQFNLNGIRVTEAALDRALREPGAALITVSYEDKFGPLGTIAALTARQVEATLKIDSWVMSCRAFSRRIEHHCLQYLFERFAVERIEASFRQTDRNGPMREFLATLLAAPPGDHVSITREAFAERAPLLVHRVGETAVKAFAGT